MITAAPMQCRLRCLADRLRTITPEVLVRVSGLIEEIADSHYLVAGLSRAVKLGDQVTIKTENGPKAAIVSTIRKNRAVVLPYERHAGVRVGDSVQVVGPLQLAPDPSWRGRVLNALGMPIDGGSPLRQGVRSVAADQPAPSPLGRAPIGGGLRTGVTAIDLFTPIAAGQRICIFAGSGVGKSTLLAMLSRSPQADVIVLALVGERGREVRDFIFETLGTWRDSMIAIVATSDESTTMRRLAPRTAMAVAESFRDAGRSVLLIMDSLTRFAHAQRDYALAAGEPPVARGYPPSVFRELASLLERAGPGESVHGSITMVATVLIDGDDHNDPVADAVRGIADGHLVLDRAIGDAGRWPAIDVLRSISRLADRVWTTEQARIVSEARTLVARYEDTKDLRALGDYRPNADPVLDRAIAVVPELYRRLEQRIGDAPTIDPFVVLADLLHNRC